MEKCNQAFKKLKNYLSSPPLLSKPVVGEELYLYLAISSIAISTVLMWEQEKIQKPVYYISRTLHDAEIGYIRIEELIFTLIISVRRLRPYFQAHLVMILLISP